MKTLKKKYESENSCYTEAGREKPTRLTQRINQKYRNKNSNWSRKRFRDVFAGIDPDLDSQVNKHLIMTRG
jgi:hypothetical protein